MDHIVELQLKIQKLEKGYRGRISSFKEGFNEMRKQYLKAKEEIDEVIKSIEGEMIRKTQPLRMRLKDAMHRCKGEPITAWLPYMSDDHKPEVITQENLPNFALIRHKSCPTTAFIVGSERCGPRFRLALKDGLRSTEITIACATCLIREFIPQEKVWSDPFNEGKELLVKRLAQICSRYDITTVIVENPFHLVGDNPDGYKGIIAVSPLHLECTDATQGQEFPFVDPKSSIAR